MSLEWSGEEEQSKEDSKGTTDAVEPYPPGRWLSTRKGNRSLKVPTVKKRPVSHSKHQTLRLKSRDHEASATGHKEVTSTQSAKRPRYCCAMCEKWYDADNLMCKSKEEHLSITGRHKRPPRAPSPDSMWNISFPDSEDEQ